MPIRTACRPNRPLERRMSVPVVVGMRTNGLVAIATPRPTRTSKSPGAVGWAQRGHDTPEKQTAAGRASGGLSSGPALEGEWAQVRCRRINRSQFFAGAQCQTHVIASWQVAAV
jgi:hypothetical protein